MGFQQSDPKMYAQQKIRGKIREWMEQDVFRKLSVLNGAGWMWDAATLTLKKGNGKALYNPNTPWSYHTDLYAKNCSFDHHVLFNNFGIISPSCLKCWKVVATPETFTDLMEMEEIQKQAPWPCKCGIELRDYTPKHYGAYFYNGSLEEGRDKYEAVKDVILKNMTNGKRIAETLILKRGCTEFEFIKGPSPYWCMTPKEERLHEMIESYVDYDKNNHKQSELGRLFVYQNWALWAHSNGDMTYKDWNDGHSLFPGYVKYHEGDIETIKEDLETAKKFILDGGTQPKSEEQPIMPTFSEESKGEDEEIIT